MTDETNTPDTAPAQDPNALQLHTGQLSKEMEKRIPSYDECSDEKKAALDGIINDVDLDDPNAALNFGHEPLDDLDESTTQIANDMTNSNVGAYGDAITDYWKQAEALGIEGLSADVKAAMKGGANKAGTLFRKAGRNWKSIGAGMGTAALLATVAAPFTFGMSLPLAGAAMAGGLGKAAYNEHQRDKTDGGKAEKITDRIKGTIIGFDSMTKNLALKRDNIPKQRERLQALRNTSEEAILGTAVYIGAGRELLARLKGEIDDLAAQDNDPDKLQARRRFAIKLDQKLAVIESTFAISVGSIANITQMEQALDDADIALQSICGPEKALTKLQLANGSMALDTFKTTESLQKYRTSMRDLRKDTNEIVQISGKQARAARPDSPELLKDYADYIDALKAGIEKQKTDLGKFEQESKKMRQSLLEKADSLADTMKEAEAQRAEVLADAVLGTTKGKKTPGKVAKTSGLTQQAASAFSNDNKREKTVAKPRPKLSLGGPGGMTPV